MDDEERDREIMAFLRSEQASYYRGDFDAFKQHWRHGPEVRRILSGPNTGTRVHVGWDDLEGKFAEGFRQFPQHFDAAKLLRWDNVQITATGDMAWVSYDQIAVEYHAGMHVSPFSHEVKIIQKFGGAWKLVCLVVVVPALGGGDVPQIELDAAGRVIALNELAQQRLDGHEGLTVSNGRPRALNRACDSGLQDAIVWARTHLATNLPRGYLQQPARVVPLGDNTGGMPMFCWVYCEQERVIVSFDDQAKLRASLEAGAASFALSAAQVNLAELISSGHDLAGAAGQMGVSVNTVRTQLRRMFEKTQTHNQAALISRLLNSGGPE